jgi:hypothetical protein
MGVGVVSGAIETVGGAIVGEVLERATQKISSKALRAGAVFTVGTFTEALEEASQEVAAITGESVYKDVDWNEVVGRTLSAAAGGAFLGGAMKGLQAGVGKVIQGPPSDMDKAMQQVQEIAAFEEQAHKLEESIEKDVEAAPAKPVQITPEAPTEAVEARAAAEPTITPEKAEGAVEEKPVVPFVGKQAKARAVEQAQTAKSDAIQGQVAEVVEADFTAKETQKKLDELTSARQAAIEEDRKALGLKEINSKDRKGWEKSLKEAKDKNIPAKAQRLADEINAMPRALNDVETAGVVIRMAELKNEHEVAMDSIAASKDEANTTTHAAEINRIEAEFESLSRAVDMSGTEKGRALVAQKLTINRQYDLISVKTRAKVAKGKALSAKEAAQLETLTTQLAEANAKIDALAKEMAELKAMKNLKTVRTARGFAQMSETQRNTNLSDLASDVNALLKQGCAN